MTKKKWDKSTVKAAILERYRAGKDMSSESMRLDDQGLQVAAKKHYNGWYAALEECEIPPSKYRKHKVWTRDVVISVLKRYRYEGKDIRPVALHKTDHGLLAAGMRLFGNSRAMYEAAGIEPAEIGALRSWSKKEVIQAIKTRNQTGMDLDYPSMRRKSPALLSAAEKYFDGWFEALKAAGISENRHRLKKPSRYWTKDTVKKMILRKHGEGRSMSYAEVRWTDPDLFSAACAAFGTWYAALDAAGVPSEEWRTHVTKGYWTKDRIVDEIRSRNHDGIDLGFAAMRRESGNLVYAAIEVFGGWYTAVEAAGFDPERIRKQKPFGYWSKERVVQEILRIRDLNEDLSDTGIREAYSALYTGGRKAFGTWGKAVESAGLDYRAIRKDRMQEGFEGLVFEVYVREALRVLGWNVRYHKRIRCGQEVCVPDFFDTDTGTWIDAKLNCSGAGVQRMVVRYLQYTPSMKVIYLKGRVNKRYGQSVEFTPIRSYYPKLLDNGAHELVDSIELLRHGVTEPNIQSRVVDFVSSVSPSSTTIIRAQLRKVLR